MRPIKTPLGIIIAFAVATTAFGGTSESEYRARQAGFSLSQRASLVTYAESNDSVKITLSLPRVPADEASRTYSLNLIDHDYKPGSGEFGVDEIYNSATYERCYRNKAHKCSQKALGRADQIFSTKMSEFDLVKYEKRWLSERDDVILGKWAD